MTDTVAPILFLHGFRSSPNSWKANLLREAMRAEGREDELYCPQLSHEPAQAIATAEAVLATATQRGPVTLVGSSLGGYYATWLAERHQLRTVLVNPSVIAHISLTQFLGPQTWFDSGDTFEFTPAHIAQLKALEVPQPDPSRYLLLAETGDEVLDYRQAVERYAGCQQVVLEGGNHSFSRFPEYIPQILAFARQG